MGGNRLDVKGIAVRQTTPLAIAAAGNYDLAIPNSHSLENGFFVLRKVSANERKVEAG